MSIIAKAVVAAVSLTLAAPVLAEDPKPAEARPAAATGYQPSEATRVCIKQTLTGSRVPKTICNTMKDWKAKGIDPFQR